MDRPLIQLTTCTVDLSRSVVIRGEDQIRLSAMENRLQSYLVEHPNQLLSRETLLADVWGYKPNLRMRRLCPCPSMWRGGWWC